MNTLISAVIFPRWEHKYPVLSRENFILIFERCQVYSNNILFYFRAKVYFSWTFLDKIDLDLTAQKFTEKYNVNTLKTAVIFPT